MHLYLNLLGVRSVTMRALNRQRATIVLGSIIERNHVPDPAEVRARESIFSPGGRLVLGGTRLGHCRIGVSLLAVVAHLTRLGDGDVGSTVENLLREYANEKYILLCTRSRWGRAEVLICLKPAATPRDTLQAWAHALLSARNCVLGGVVDDTLERARNLVDDNMQALLARGWNPDESCLLTSTDRRIEVVQHQKD